MNSTNSFFVDTFFTQTFPIHLLNLRDTPCRVLLLHMWCKFTQKRVNGKGQNFKYYYISILLR